jgi:hypothetical protein
MKDYIVKLLFGFAGQVLAQIFTYVTNKDMFNKTLKLAQSHVNKLAGNDTLDGPAKRDAAEAGLKSELTALGYDVRNSVINLAIEFAVNAAKSAKQ